MDEIELTIDAEVAVDSIDRLSKGASDAIAMLSKMEGSIKAVNTETERQGGLLGANAKAATALKSAVSGAFDDSAFTLAALNKQLQDFAANTTNVLNKLLGAQATAFNRLSTGVNEAQVQKFQQNPSPAGSALPTDATVLKQQIAAESRNANLTTQAGGTADLTRLKELEDQLVRVNAQRDRQNAAIREEVRLEALAASGQQKAPVVAPAPLTGEQKAAASFQSTTDKFNLNGGADLFKVQAQVLANYAIVNQAIGLLQSGASFIVDFEAQLKELQAIVGATDTEVAALAQRFIDVSKNSKFSAPEITGAAVILGQAGLSPDQIGQSIESIVKLATATGTDLKVAVDIATTVMSVFNVRATEMGNVANIVTAALNQSKLDAEKLALGLQYAGNIASESGVSFVELTTALAAMSNAGIKSGSTLGTGFRQVIQALVDPSAKLKATLSDLGLTMGDIDIRTHGIFGVLSNLRDAGFTTADAMQDLGLRGASAFAALSNQSSGLQELQQAILLTGDASKANATQMDSLQSQYKRLGSAAGALAATVFAPLAQAVKEGLSVFADFAGLLSGISGPMTFLATAVGVGATLAFAKWFATFAIGLLDLKGLISGLIELTLGTYSAAAGVDGLSTAMSLLGKSTPILIALTLGITAALTVFDLFGKSTQNVASQMEALQTQVDDSKGKVDNYNTTIAAISEEMDKLGNRHQDLSKDGDQLKSVILELNNRFRDMGMYVDSATTSVDGLIAKMAAFRQEQRAGLAAQLQTQTAQVVNQGLSQDQVVQGQFGYSAAQDAISKSGLRPGTDFAFNPNQPGVAAAAASASDVFDSISGGTAPSTDAQMSAQVGKYQAQIQVLTQRRQALGDALTGDALTVSNGIALLIGILSGDQDNISKRMGLTAQAAGLQKQANNAGVDAGPMGDSVGTLVQTYQQKLSKLKSDNSGLDPNGNPVPQDDDTKKAYAASLDALAAQYKKDSAALINGLSASDLAAFNKTDLPDIMKSEGSEINAADKGQDDIQNKINTQLNDYADKVIMAKISALLATVNKNTPTADIAAIPAQLAALYGQLTTNQQANAGIAKKAGLAPGDSTQVAGHISQDIADVNNVKLAEDIGKVTDYLKSAGQKASSAAEKAALVPKGLDDLTRSLKSLTDTFKLSTDAADNMVKDQQTRIAALSLRNNGNADNISDVQRAQLALQTEAINAAADQAKLAALTTFVDGLKVTAAANAAILAGYKQTLAGLGGDGTSSGDAAADSAKAKVKADIEKTETQSLKINDDLLSRDAARLELLNKINIANAKVAALSPSEGFNQAVQQWQIESGATKSLNVQLIDSYKSMFSSASSGLSQFMQDVLSGTKTIGQAFSDMATSILQSMLKIASDKIAADLISSALGGIGSIFGASSFSGATASASTGGSFFSAAAGLRQGGKVMRAAQGVLVPGDTPGRDGTPAVLMPGEYVSTQSTVSTLGSGFFASLNATGGQSLIQTLTAMNKPQQQVARKPDMVNVYVTQDKPPPTMGAKDVVAAIANDLAKSGPTHKLVKAIAMGTA